MVANYKLITWISDQRDPAHRQKLAHFTTTDCVHRRPVGHHRRHYARHRAIEALIATLQAA
jgi:hypothetical protein